MTKLIVAIRKFANATENVYRNYEIMSGVTYASRYIIQIKHKLATAILENMQLHPK
jgi:hypothetical protein